MLNSTYCRITACCALLWVPPASACLWIHGTMLDGTPTRLEDVDVPEEMERVIGEKPLDRKSLFEPHAYVPADPVAEKNDKAVQKLLRGDVQNALKELKSIEHFHPGIYITAANLGTALELAGQDDEAMAWIKEGIRRNPASHMFAEWLHVKVLEAKLKLRSDPEWLAGNTIVGFDARRIGEPGYELETAQGPKGLKHIKDALIAQLLVRSLFIKPEDSIMAQLYWELAVVESHVGTVEQALSFAGFASRYGLPQMVSEALTQKWSEVTYWADWRRALNPVRLVPFITVLLPFLVLWPLLQWIWRPSLKSERK